MKAFLITLLFFVLSACNTNSDEAANEEKQLEVQSDSIPLLTEEVDSIENELAIMQDSTIISDSAVLIRLAYDDTSLSVTLKSC